jgi:hypothetical protein
MRALALVVLLGVGVMGPAGLAGAQEVIGPGDRCDDNIVDGGDVLDETRLEPLIAEAADLGARVVVRGYQSIGPHTVDDLTASADLTLEQCFDAASGAAPADLALLSFSLDERSADVYVGTALAGQATSDRMLEAMTGAFGDGAFTEGVALAVEELLVELRAVDQGSPASESHTDGAGEGNGSGGGGGGSIGLGVGALGIGAAVAGGGLVLARRRRRVAARQALERAVAGPRSRVGAVREKTQRLERQAELWVVTSTGRTAERLNELTSRVRRAAGGTDEAAALLGQATPKGIADASLDEVKRANERLAALAAALDHHEHVVDELTALGARLDHLRVAVPAKRSLLVEELEASTALCRGRRSQGWEVDEESGELASIGASLDAVDLEPLGVDLLTLSDEVEGAEARLFATHHRLQSLPDRLGALEDWHRLQVESVAMERRRLGEIRDELAEAAAVHAEASWAVLADHPDRAEAQLTECLARSEEAIALARRSQDHEEAGRQLEAAGLELMVADDLLDQVEDLLIDLDEARHAARGLLTESRAMADSFGQYVEQHRGDLDPDLIGRPDALDELLDDLDHELILPLPNYLRVAQTADRFNREIDGLLAAARQQHERMEALRRQAQREVGRAERNIRRARKSLGWQLIPSREARDLDELERRLSSLPAEPEERFVAATGIADEAVAVQELVISRRRRHGNWIVIGGHTTSGAGWGGSSPSSGGGGGTSFGGGGGGGISFGGGGGGGRSFGGGRSSGGW